MPVVRTFTQFSPDSSKRVPCDHVAEDKRSPLDNLDDALIAYLETHPEQLPHMLGLLLGPDPPVEIVSNVPDNIDFWPGITLTRLCHMKLTSQHVVACRAAIDSMLYHTSAESLLKERDTSEVVLKEVRRVFELELVAFLQGLGRLIHLVQVIRRSPTTPTDPRLREGVQLFLEDLDSTRKGVRKTLGRLRKKSPLGGDLLKFLLRYVRTTLGEK